MNLGPVSNPASSRIDGDMSLAEVQVQRGLCSSLAQTGHRAVFQLKYDDKCNMLVIVQFADHDTVGQPRGCNNLQGISP